MRCSQRTHGCARPHIRPEMATRARGSLLRSHKKSLIPQKEMQHPTIGAAGAPSCTRCKVGGSTTARSTMGIGHTQIVRCAARPLHKEQ